jgi:putative acetyltransferase
VRGESVITVIKVDPSAESVQTLVAELDAYQASLYPPESNHLDSARLLSQDHVQMFAAKIDGVVAGCGAVKIFDQYAELKRMYVLERYRGRGVASILLDTLEQEALVSGRTRICLETGIRQTAALTFYRSNGYMERGPYAAYEADPFSVFMEKTFGGPALEK